VKGGTFLAAAIIGVFYLARSPAIVPDVLLSLDVELLEDWWAKEHRSYFLLEFGKPPDLALEIVSNKKGKENVEKKVTSARMRVPYYVIFDPRLQAMSEILKVYKLEGFAYEEQTAASFPDLGLSLHLWSGKYGGKKAVWLRWVSLQGDEILSGKERAEEERQRADVAELKWEPECQRAERLAGMLRQLGQNPD
jgi:Putative restriction endonuclease